MGVFQTMTEVINRTSKPLMVRYDGQDSEIAPNYDAEGNLLPDVHNQLPDITVPYAKAQNVLMGSEDPFDPSEFVVLVGVKAKTGQKQKDDISFCEQSSELTRVKLDEYLDDPTAKIVVAGKRNQRRAKLGEANVPGVVDAAPFRR